MTVKQPTKPPPPDQHNHDGSNDECWGGRHLPVVVYTRRPRDLFRRRYWLLCWECDFRQGPFEVVAMAELEREITER
jgi:hypothetical protein